MDTLPEPNDDEVGLVTVPGETVAALRFTGDRRSAAVAARTTELLDALKDTAFNPTGTPVGWFYDPPWTPVPAAQRGRGAGRSSLTHGRRGNHRPQSRSWGAVWLGPAASVLGRPSDPRTYQLVLIHLINDQRCLYMLMRAARNWLSEGRTGLGGIGAMLLCIERYCDTKG